MGCIGGKSEASLMANLQSYQYFEGNVAKHLYLLVVLLKGVYMERGGFSGWYRDFAYFALLPAYFPLRLRKAPI